MENLFLVYYNLNYNEVLYNVRNYRYNNNHRNKNNNIDHKKRIHNNMWNNNWDNIHIPHHNSYNHYKKYKKLYYLFCKHIFDNLVQFLNTLYNLCIFLQYLNKILAYIMYKLYF